MNINYPDAFIKNILEKTHTIAVVGASANKERDSYKVMNNLIKNGYKVFPVNPNETGNLILGQECYSNIEDIKTDIDLVDIFREKEAVMGIAKQAIKIGAKFLWMQEGIIHDEAASLVESAGIKVIMNRCIKKELSKPMQDAIVNGNKHSKVIFNTKRKMTKKHLMKYFLTQKQTIHFFPNTMFLLWHNMTTINLEQMVIEKY